MDVPVLIKERYAIHKEWVMYVLNTFKFVTGASMNFYLAHDFDADYGFAIVYGEEEEIPEKADKVLLIPPRPSFRPNVYECIIWTGQFKEPRLENEEIPVFEGTFAETAISAGAPIAKSKAENTAVIGLLAAERKQTIGFKFDILYNAFIHLGCLEEEESVPEVELFLSYSYNLNRDEIFYKKPIVNYLFAYLEKIVVELLGEGLFERNCSFTIALTHDVDYVKKTLAVRAKNFPFRLVNSFRPPKESSLRGGMKEAPNCIRFLFQKSDYWQFDYWQELERKEKARSCFFFFMRIPAVGYLGAVKQMVFDPSYSIARDCRLRDKIRDLHDNGWQIGLHSSFNCHDSLNRMLVEKNRMEETLGIPVAAARQHWLRFLPQHLFTAQENAGIRVDMSLGFTDKIGFRAGIASSFYPYDFKKKRAYDVLEVPMVAVDSAVFDYQAGGNRDGLFSILEEVKKFSGQVSIDWHQHGAAREYGWNILYEEILDWIRENSGNTELQIR